MSEVDAKHGTTVDDGCHAGTGVPSRWSLRPMAGACRNHPDWEDGHRSSDARASRASIPQPLGRPRGGPARADGGRARRPGVAGPTRGPARGPDAARPERGGRARRRRRRFLPRRHVGLDHDPRLDDHVPRPRRGPRCRDEPVRRPRPGEGRRVGDPDPRRVLPVRQARHDRPGAGRPRAAARPRARDHREPARDPRPRRVMDHRRPGRDLPGRRRAACLAARGRPPGHGGGPGAQLEVLAPDGTTPLFAGAFSTTVVVRPAEPGTRLQLDAQPAAHDTYRGALKVVLSGSSARVVNRVGLDDYLRGVLPVEMPSSWPGAALQGPGGRLAQLRGAAAAPGLRAPSTSTTTPARRSTSAPRPRPIGPTRSSTPRRVRSSSRDGTTARSTPSSTRPAAARPRTTSTRSSGRRAR